MKTKMITTVVAALSALALVANAQDNDRFPGGPPPNLQRTQQGEGGPGGPRGFHLLPPRAQEMLKLTSEQKTQVAALEAETKAKLEKILTPEQLTQLKNQRPPMRPGGQNGPGAGENNPPPGPPPGDQ